MWSAVSKSSNPLDLLYITLETISSEGKEQGHTYHHQFPDWHVVIVDRVRTMFSGGAIVSQVVFVFWLVEVEVVDTRSYLL